jgi:hypothetical protein
VKLPLERIVVLDVVVELLFCFAKLVGIGLPVVEDADAGMEFLYVAGRRTLPISLIRQCGEEEETTKTHE